MKSDALLIRAIGVEFAGRKLNSLALPLVVVSIVVLGLVVWLATTNAWWWLLAVPIIGLTCALVGLIILAYGLIRGLRPQINKQQTAQVASFVDKLERVSEHLQTPLPWIIFRIIIDIVRKPNTTFIHSMTKDGTTLHVDYLRLRKDLVN